MTAAHRATADSRCTPQLRLNTSCHSPHTPPCPALSKGAAAGTGAIHRDTVYPKGPRHSFYGQFILGSSHKCILSQPLLRLDSSQKKPGQVSQPRGQAGLRAVILKAKQKACFSSGWILLITDPVCCQKDGPFHFSLMNFKEGPENQVWSCAHVAHSSTCRRNGLDEWWMAGRSTKEAEWDAAEQMVHNLVINSQICCLSLSDKFGAGPFLQNVLNLVVCPV